jgi:alkanesulfonate monooxygenase SsuD/methylene tetrahydromethanopterin reductase-like flavin-dependent oxidoreductase (luciferase family)
MHVAADAVTFEPLAPGRILLGLGAGHTPSEWADIGQDRPRPRQRAQRLAEFVEVIAGSPTTLSANKGFPPLSASVDADVNV